MKQLSYFVARIYLSSLLELENINSREGNKLVNQIFGKWAKNILKHSKIYIAIVCLLTVIFSFGLTRIQMKMGNDVFVSTNSDIYKNTRTYQKNFGGDSAYLMLSGSQKEILSHKTMRKVSDFSKQAEKIDNVKSTTSVVSLLNDLIKKSDISSMMTSTSSTNNSNLQKDLFDNLSTKQKTSLQEKLQQSLTQKQQASMAQYATGLLTDKQKLTLASKVQAGANQNAALQSILTKKQAQQLQAYTLSLLNAKQKKAFMNTVIKMMPSVEDMSTPLLRDIMIGENGKVRSQFKQLLPQNGKNILVLVNTTDKTSDMSTNVQLRSDLEKAIKQTHFGSEYKINLAGQPVIMGQIKTSVMNTMVKMVIIALILMVLVLLLLFAVRRRLFSLLFVLLGMIWTFGLMGWIGLPITLATMATLPIIIGLGTDFGVQFHNRYEEEFRKNQNAAQSSVKAAANIGPAVGVAVIMMALSFLTMLLSKAPMMQQFGITLAIGVVCVYLVEFIMVFAVMPSLDARTSKKELKLKKSNKVGKLLAKYANFIMKHSAIVLIIGGVIAVCGFAVENKIGTETNLTKLIPESLPSLVQTKNLQKKVGSTTYLTYLVKADDIKDKNNLKEIDRIGKQVNNKYADVTEVQSISTIYKQLGGTYSESQSQINKTINNLPASMKDTTISSNNHYAAIQFKVKNSLNSDQQYQLMEKINQDIDGKHGAVTVSAAGATMMQLVGVKNMTSNHYLIIGAGLVIIFIVLLIVYRNWKLAMYPLVPILIVLGASPLTLWVRGGEYNPVTVTLSSLILGVGIEFTILILERYQEEIKKTNTRNAVLTAISSVGSAITVSGLTVIVGFSAIIFADFPALSSFGANTVTDTAYSLFAALTFMPAIIYLCRNRKEDNKN